MNARPVFLKWSLALFVVLLPILAYSIWDLVEATRLQSRVQLVTQPAQASRNGDVAIAERYYRAAAALASYGDTESVEELEARNRNWKAIHDGEWTPEVVAAARRRVDRNREALDFVDRASTLPFAGFGYVRYPGNAGRFMQLGLLCEQRAMVRAADGDGDGAVASVYSEARLGRAMEDAFDTPTSWVFLPRFANLQRVLERAKPSASSRESLSASLAELDRDDRMKQQLVRFRIAMLNQVGMSRPPSLMPEALLTHLKVRSLDTFTRLITASEQPWPTRIAAAIAVGEWPLPTVWAFTGVGRKLLENYTQMIADQTQRVRCARLTVDGRLNLIDPFTGKRLEMLNCHL